jgi:hypothetical protein
MVEITERNDARDHELGCAYLIPGRYLEKPPAKSRNSRQHIKAATWKIWNWVLIPLKRRSEGLLKFTESYRSLNKITKLDLNKLLVRNMFENLASLMRPTLEKKNIELEIILRDPALAIEADINLIDR